MASRALRNLARFYNSNFDRRPEVTLVVTNGGLNTLADALAQTTTMLTAAPGERLPYDIHRTLRFAVFGAALGPFIGKWMKLLERTIPIRVGQPGNGIQLVKRVIADQVFLAPLGLALFVGAMGAMEGRSMQGIQDKYSDMYWPALLANWKVWPLIQGINFKLMPIQYRVPFQSSCGIAWNLYLSLLNASGGGGAKSTASSGPGAGSGSEAVGA